MKRAIDINKMIEDIKDAKKMYINMGLSDPVVYMNQKTFDALKAHVEQYSDIDVNPDMATIFGMHIGIVNEDGMVFMVTGRQSRPW